MQKVAPSVPMTGTYQVAAAKDVLISRAAIWHNAHMIEAAKDASMGTILRMDDATLVMHAWQGARLAIVVLNARNVLMIGWLSINLMVSVRAQSVSI